MPKSSHPGTLPLLASLALGLLLLLCIYFFRPDNSSAILAGFVLVLFCAGQWLAADYWRKNRDEVGKALQGLDRTVEELRQAVGASPAAMEAPLQALSQRLADNGKGTAEAGEDARKSWEQSAQRISARLEEAVSGITARAGENSTALAAKVGEGAAQLESLAGKNAAQLASQAEKNAALLSAQLEKASERLEQGLTGPLDSLRETLAAGQARAQAQAEAAANSVAESAAAAMAEAVRNQGEDIARELRAAAAAAAQAGEEARSSLAAEAARLQAGWEKNLGALREFSEDAGRAAEAAALALEKRVAELEEQLDRGAREFQELAHLSRVNQTEMQAGVAMLNASLVSILERMDGQAAAGEGQQAFLAGMNQALASFQERAAEVLEENALKTQEILLDLQAGRKLPADAGAEWRTEADNHGR